MLITRQTVQFNLASDHWLDVTWFTEYVAASQRHRHRRLEACQLCIGHLSQAAGLYRGEFLEGFTVADSTAFEEWALLKREWLHRQALEVLPRGP